MLTRKRPTAGISPKARYADPRERWWPRHAAAAAVALALLAGGAPVAEAQSQKAVAEALFGEGRRLMAEGKVAEACPKFADSQRLDPSSGTLLNLGNCYEKLGRTATAWATYREAQSHALANSRPENARVAEKRATTLEPRLARVKVTVTSAVPGLELRRDGVAVTSAEWGLAVPIDPGSHTYEARAPRYRAWQTTIDVAEATTATVTVPSLQAAPDEPAPPVRDRTAETEPPSRVLPVAIGAVGIVALGVGAGFALAAKSTYDDSLRECPNEKNLCTPAGVQLRDDARTRGNVATVGFAVGGVALAAAAVVWFVTPARTKVTAGRVRVAPSLGGVVVQGTW